DIEAATAAFAQEPGGGLIAIPDTFTIGRRDMIIALAASLGSVRGIRTTRGHVVADIFISYSKQHPQPPRDLAAYLEREGYSVWWDTNLLAGEIFREVIDRELNAAKAVIVIWTRESVRSDWVLAEADQADRHGKL